MLCCPKQVSIRIRFHEQDMGRIINRPQGHKPAITVLYHIIKLVLWKVVNLGPSTLCSKAWHDGKQGDK